MKRCSGSRKLLFSYVPICVFTIEIVSLHLFQHLIPNAQFFLHQSILFFLQIDPIVERLSGRFFISAFESLRSGEPLLGDLHADFF